MLSKTVPFLLGFTGTVLVRPVAAVKVAYKFSEAEQPVETMTAKSGRRENPGPQSLPS